MAVLKVKNIISKRSDSTNLKLIFPKMVLAHALNNQTYSSYVVVRLFSIKHKLSDHRFFHAEANRLEFNYVLVFMHLLIVVFVLDFPD